MSSYRCESVSERRTSACRLHGTLSSDDTSPQLVTLVRYSSELLNKKGEINDIQKRVHHMPDEYGLCNIKCPISLVRVDISTLEWACIKTETWDATSLSTK